LLKIEMESRKTRSEGGVVLNFEDDEWSIIPRCTQRIFLLDGKEAGGKERGG
jgi:hypothetical protein